MAMRGYYDLLESFEDTPAPYVRVRVYLRHTGYVAELDFLVDTGAYATVLHPDDVDRMGIDMRSLRGRQTAASDIGGSMSYLAWMPCSPCTTKKWAHGVDSRYSWAYQRQRPAPTTGCHYCLDAMF